MNLFTLYLAIFASSIEQVTRSELVNVSIDPNNQEQYTQWDYKPNVWSYDDDQMEFAEDYSSHEDQGEIFDTEIGEIVQSISTDNPHKLHHYLEPDKNLKQQLKRDEQCTQFRVDIREAVVCDNKRCDKLDFVYPDYDNQLKIIETTKHGMRFHQTNLAFASIIKKQPSNYKVDKDSSLDVSQIKFDIFELFKPKPGTTSTTTEPPTSPNSTTDSPNETTTNPIDEKNSDTNTTRLITTFRLDTRRKKQKMIGFGGALSDSTCRNIKSLSSEMAKSLTEDYYGQRGLKYNIARMTIGSSDFSTTPYTNNDRPYNETQKFALDEKDDVEMNNFHLTKEDYEFKMPIARQAIATSGQEIKFFASLWSPPIWMKNNSDIVHGYLKGDVYGPYYKALAELMIKWLEAYKKNGIDFWAITGLNEPVTGVKPFIFHNSLGITKDDYITFFKIYLGPMMRRRGFQNVELIMLDDNKGYGPSWVKAMLEDQEAAKYISGVAFHWYMNDEYENLNFIPKTYPDKVILATEACNGFLPFQVHVIPGNWDRGVAYLYDIIKMVQKNAAVWVDWNMALDLRGGPSWANNNLDAAVIVNAKRNEYYKSPMFYAIGHFSRFVDPGSIRLDYILANAKFDYPVEAVGFLTPKNYIVIVALNANRHPVPFKIIVDKQLVRVMTLRADSFNTIIFKWKSIFN